MSNQSLKAVVVIVFLGVAGALIILLMTPHGVGITPDSTVYLDAAASLSRGAGLNVWSNAGELTPLTHYPPLYSSLLALLGKAGATLEVSARLLNAILFAITILLVGLIATTCARDSFWLPLLGSLATLLAVDIASAYSFALSEPLFISLTLAAVFALTQYLIRVNRYWLMISAAAVGLSLLTRYVGVASLGAGCCVLLLGNYKSYNQAASVKRRDLYRRFLDVVLFAAIASGPAIIWIIRNRWVSARSTDRELHFHPNIGRDISSALSTVMQWLVLGKVSRPVRVIGFGVELVALGLLLAYSLRHRADISQPKSKMRLVLFVLLSFIAFYVAVVTFTAWFVDADTGFDSRILLPVHVMAIIGVLGFAGAVYADSTSRLFRHALIVIVVLLFLSHGFRLGRSIRTSRQDGQGYASRTWTESPSIRIARSVPPEVRIYSNGYDAINYLTSHRAILIPEKIIHGTGRVNPNYKAEMSAVSSEIRDNRAVLIYFNNLTERSYLPTLHELESSVGPPFESFADGVIFYSPLSSVRSL